MSLKVFIIVLLFSNCVFCRYHGSKESTAEAEADELIHDDVEETETREAENDKDVENDNDLPHLKTTEEDSNNSSIGEEIDNNNNNEPMSISFEEPYQLPDDEEWPEVHFASNLSARRSVRLPVCPSVCPSA